MSKTFDKKDVFTIVTAEEAKSYIGKLGYFGNSLEELEREINENNCDELKEIVYESYTSNAFRPRGFEITTYSLFLPTDKVKEVEEPKKYRPFTLKEFNKVIPMGTVFKYKYKRNNVNDIYSVYYHANLDCENGFQAIFFEDSYHDFDYCFNEMKLFLNGDWKPFGVEE